MLLLLFTTCSTQKNTWSTRHYHELNTRYNVHFNGNEAYKQGIKQIKNGHKDDLSQLLPMYQISNHGLGKSASGSMDRAIEKSRAAIKKHSIRVKPKNKPNSKSKSSYKDFYNKEEFNPFMDDVFMLMANAQFHKADFESCASSCSYIMRHFNSDKITHDKAAILLARSYTELGWYYEAEKTLADINNTELTKSLTGEFSAANADFLLRKKMYNEAVPFLKIAIDKCKDKKQKTRWLYLLGQIFQLTGNKSEAGKIFSQIPGKNPPYEMELSSRIRLTEVYQGSNTKKPLKKLLRLSKSDKNKDYLDQIYYALGNLYLLEKDTTKALENFHLSLNKSTQNGPHKLKTLLALGDFYYKNENFIKAGPCYADAATILKKEDERSEQAFLRNDILKELAPPLQNIYVEDSLQALAKLPKKELDKIIDKLVKDAEKKAKEESRAKNAAEALNANSQLNQGNKQSNTPKTPEIQDPNNKNWYFFNPSTVSKGLSEFQNKWGKRALADDWRRNNKSSPFEQNITSNLPEEQVVQEDSTEAVADFSEGAEDPVNPNFYLKNIPFTEEQLKVSNEKIAEGLFTSGVIFRDKMENNKLAMKQFKTLESRFSENKNLETAWYYTYLISKQDKEDDTAEKARVKLLETFPESKYAKRLADTFFVENLKIMYKYQDSIFASYYNDFTENKADSIFKTAENVRQKYPLTGLMPRFGFLEAIEHGRTGNAEEFFRILTDLNKDYPEHALNPVIKQMLAFWESGRRPAISKGYKSLLSVDSLSTGDTENIQDSLINKLIFEPKSPHIVMISYDADSTNVNRLMFDVALYNFTTFLIRDYEISVGNVGKMDVLLIQGFEDSDEAIRYHSTINFQDEDPEKKYKGSKIYIVSTKNLQILMQGLNTDLYQEFFNKNYKFKKSD